MFPHNREVPDVTLQELTGTLFHMSIGASGLLLDVRVIHEWSRLYDFSHLYRGLLGTGAQQASRLRGVHQTGWRKPRVFCLRSG